VNARQVAKIAESRMLRLSSCPEFFEGGNVVMASRINTDADDRAAHHLADMSNFVGVWSALA
tara:strand:+ start:1916 stop:2101 length:186 start_codon:yes stop_codon:yes gene_type:complete